MLVKDIFAEDITRDIPPVIYFHEQSPEKLQAEVSEYIITGGYQEGDPRRQRVSEGIHEQFVRLLNQLAQELQNPKGSGLPACWISGFFGSGKSSFAKLLGYSLDGRKLPDGKLLSQALLERDDSPKAGEFRQAWQAVAACGDNLAVVFDVGGAARDDEHIHSVVKRKLQARLGYCELSSAVAEYELKLEEDGLWPRFLELAKSAFGQPWEQLLGKRMVEDHFSGLMHQLQPELYQDPLSWLDTRTGLSSRGAAVDETVADIDSMLKRRAPQHRVFVVVDEVSQYVFQNDQRMLKLQSFVEALGQRLKGKVWLMATGQQKLEEDLDGSNLSKLKDRFPNRLRVHLAPTNIRDVVHKRLLKKAPQQEEKLRQLYQQHGASLRLYGYGCDKLTENDFVEVYPMLPGYVDLVMHITSNLRARSTRMKGDDHAIRGLLQLLGEVFRQHQFGQQPLGSLITLDQVYDIQHTALDADIQNTMARLQGHDELLEDPLAVRVAKVVALLQQVQEQFPTTPNLVAQSLYARVGDPNPETAVKAALDKLYTLNLLSFSEKNGYRIQSSAEQEWARERDSLSASNQQLSELVKEKLKNLLAGSERPRLRGRPFPLAALYSDTRGVREDKIQASHDAAVLWFDFHYVTNQEERREENWIKESDSQTRRDRCLWVSGATSGFESKARDFLRSQAMVNLYAHKFASLSEGRKAALHHEQSRRDQLDEQVRQAVAELFLEGHLYFRARKLAMQRFGQSFSAVVKGAAEEVLTEVYQHFVDLAVTESEMKQLQAQSLVGVAQKFFDDGLGILEHDSGKIVATCKGPVPTRIREYLESENGCNGMALLQRFGGPPWGYASDLVKACVLGLLRAGQCQIHPVGGDKITSYRDPGVQDVFSKDRDFKNAEINPTGEQTIKAADRVRIRKFFEDFIGESVENENESLADAAFLYLRPKAEQLRQLFSKLNQLRPLQPPLPKALEQLEATLSRCLQSRQVESTLVQVRKHLDQLRDGVQQLDLYRHELNDDEAIERVKRIQRVYAVECEQLQQVGQAPAAGERLRQQLESPTPWRDAHSLLDAAADIERAYRDERKRLLHLQEEFLDALIEEVKLREGFSSLDPEQGDSVLRQIRGRRVQSEPEAISPPLIVLRDSVLQRLKEGAELAHQHLDELLSHQNKVQVVPVKLELSNRELSSVEEVELLLAELRERLLAQLKGNSRIRLT